MPRLVVHELVGVASGVAELGRDRRTCAIHLRAHRFQLRLQFLAKLVGIEILGVANRAVQVVQKTAQLAAGAVDRVACSADGAVAEVGCAIDLAIERRTCEQSHLLLLLTCRKLKIAARSGAGARGTRVRDESSSIYDFAPASSFPACFDVSRAG